MRAASQSFSTQTNPLLGVGESSYFQLPGGMEVLRGTEIHKKPELETRRLMWQDTRPSSVEITGQPGVD